MYLDPPILRGGKCKASFDTSTSTSQDGCMAVVRQCYNQIRASPGLIFKKNTHKVMTKLKKKANSCAAISGFGDIAATHREKVV